jgi:hypothetical protein
MKIYKNIDEGNVSLVINLTVSKYIRFIHAEVIANSGLLSVTV